LPGGMEVTNQSGNSIWDFIGDHPFNFAGFHDGMPYYEWDCIDSPPIWKLVWENTSATPPQGRWYLTTESDLSRQGFGGWESNVMDFGELPDGINLYGIDSYPDHVTATCCDACPDPAVCNSFPLTKTVTITCTGYPSGTLPGTYTVDKFGCDYFYDWYHSPPLPQPSGCIQHSIDIACVCNAWYLWVRGDSCTPDSDIAVFLDSVEWMSDPMVGDSNGPPNGNYPMTLTLDTAGGACSITVTVS
jgi:hypothetical protein